MNNKSYLSLGEAIEAFLNKHGLQKEAKFQMVLNQWEDLFGKAIASHTEKAWLEKEILHLKISSPVWKQELSLAKSQIKEVVNKHMGEELIKEVRIH